MYRLLTRAEVAAMLSSYGARHLYDHEAGSEQWATSWGFEFCLTTEADGLYHEFMVIEAERLSIQPTRPER
jgi:hypothetical protein